MEDYMFNRQKKHSHSILNFFVCLLFTANVMAQSSGKVNIAVMNLEAPDVSSSAQLALSDRLRVELFNTGRFSVMERNQMQDILKEQGFQQTGCTTNECVVEAGRLLGVDRMIAGSVGKVGTIYTVSLRMIDIETGRIMLTKTEDCNCPIEEVLTTSLKNIALKIAGMTSDAAEQPVVRRETVVGEGDFYFTSMPSGAKVYVDDKLLPGTTPLMEEGVAAGTHQIRMEKGYYSGIQTVFLEPNEFKKVELTLVKAKGGLKILSTPFEANIFLDNKPLGLSPQTLTGLDAGEHILKLTKPGYLDLEEVVTIAGDEIKRISIPLEKIKPAKLNITSQPPHCDVYLNNQLQGKTPLAVHDLMPGMVSVKVAHPMFEDWQQTLNLKNGEIRTIEPTLNKRTGNLIIKSDPPSADVLIDGAMQGQTPLTLSGIEYGTHDVVISKTNYQSQQQKIELVSAEPKTISAHLIPAKAKLSLTGAPAGAEIWLNNSSTGRLPLTNYEIDDGDYNIKVKAAGYESFTEAIHVSPNEFKTISVQLNPKSRGKALLRSFFIPGLGQGYQEKKGKAVLFPLMEIGAIVGVYLFNDKYNTAISDYNSARDAYSSAVDQSDIDGYYLQMEASYNDIESAEKMRTIFIGAAVGVWLWNVLDAALFGPATDQQQAMGKADVHKLKLYSDYKNGSGRIGVCYGF